MEIEIKKLIKEKEQVGNTLIHAIKTSSTKGEATNKLTEALSSLTLKKEDIDKLQKSFDRDEKNKFYSNNARCMGHSLSP